MEHQYLLDTNILSDLVRNPQGAVAERIAAFGEHQVCTSIIVAAELRYGAAKQGSDRLTRQLEAILSALEILPFDDPADRRYGELRTYLENQGTTIGPNDMLIASHALSLELTLVTANFGEFSSIPNLAVANWLQS